MADKTNEWSLLDKVIANMTLFNNLNLDSRNNLINALKIADKTIIERLEKTKGVWTKSRLDELQKLIGDEITMAYGGLFETIQDEIAEISNITYASLVGARIPVEVVKELVNPDRKIQDYTLENLFKLNEKSHSNQLRQVIASGVAQGRSIDGIISDYQIRSDKLSQSAIKGNLLTVVSETRKDSASNAYTRLEDDGIITGYIYSSTFDSRTSNWCINHSGKKYNKYDDILKDLKYHFRCRSDALPLTADDDEGNRTASQFGETDAKDYKEWFESTPDWFKQEKLTKKQYEAYKNGQYEVGGTIDLTKPLSLDEVKEINKKMSPQVSDEVWETFSEW